MFSIFHCCVKATHQQDSKWSLVVCICATLCQVLAMGILRSFGVLFPVLMAEFDTSRERTAWIGSFALSLTLFAATLVGRLSQKFSCRFIIIIGGLLYIAGLTATSFVNDIKVMFFTFSVLTGLGASFCRTSCFLMVAKYFNKKRSFATGSVTMGPSLGMFIWGPVTQVLLDSVGWRNTFRVMALSCTLILLLAIPFNPNIEEKDKISEVSCQEMTEPNNQDDDDSSSKSQTGNKKFKILDFSVWRIPQYCILVASFTLMFMCRFIPSVHLVKYSEELDIPADKASHFYMFLGISSGAARLLIGRLCDVKWVNIRYVNQLGITLAGLATLLLPLAKNYVSVALYTAMFGFSDGAFVTSQNVILLGIVGPDRRDAAFGFGCMLYSFVVAGGPPFAGLIADKLASYKFSFYTAGSMMLLSGAVQFCLFCFKSTASETKREELTCIATMVADSEGMSEKSHCKENDHKEQLSELYIDSTLRKNCKISASVESMQLL